MAATLDRHGHPGNFIGTKGFPGRGFDTDKGAVGRKRRRIATTAVRFHNAGHMLGFLVNKFHVFHRGAHVFSSDVAAIERVDKTAKGTENLFTIGCFRIGQDHRFAGAKIQSGRRRFIGHTAGKTEHIGQGFFLAAEVPHPGAAQCWTQ